MECDNCLAEFIGMSFNRDVYDTPWETEPVERVFCSETCEESYLYDGDFSYFYCEGCEREICGQNPSNGWHVQYRDRGDGTLLCLRCYQEELFKNGLDLDTLRVGTIPGMFFDVDEVESKGWEVVDFYFVDSEKEIQKIYQQVLTLDAAGYICIIGYERLAIGGSEGTVTLYKKGRV